MCENQRCGPHSFYADPDPAKNPDAAPDPCSPGTVVIKIEEKLIKSIWYFAAVTNISLGILLKMTL
jgi:hypothetical protein